MASLLLWGLMPWCALAKRTDPSEILVLRPETDGMSPSQASPTDIGGSMAEQYHTEHSKQWGRCDKMICNSQTCGRYNIPTIAQPNSKLEHKLINSTKCFGSASENVGGRLPKEGNTCKEHYYGLKGSSEENVLTKLKGQSGEANPWFGTHCYRMSDDQASFSGKTLSEEEVCKSCECVVEADISKKAWKFAEWWKEWQEWVDKSKVGRRMLARQNSEKLQSVSFEQLCRIYDLDTSNPESLVVANKHWTSLKEDSNHRAWKIIYERTVASNSQEDPGWRHDSFGFSKYGFNDNKLKKEIKTKLVNANNNYPVWVDYMANRIC